MHLNDPGYCKLDQLDQVARFNFLKKNILLAMGQLKVDLL